MNYLSIDTAGIDCGIMYDSLKADVARRSCFMERFFQPRSIVLFGASSTKKRRIPGTPEFQAIHGPSRYPDLFIVHPKEKSIDGTACYKSLAEVPQNANGTARIDLAVIVVPVPR